MAKPVKPDDNPWAAETWSLTGQAVYTRQFGMARAHARAADAKSYVGAPDPRPPRRRYLDAEYKFTREIVES